MNGLRADAGPGSISGPLFTRGTAMIAFYPLQLVTRGLPEKTPWVNWVLVVLNVAFYYFSWMAGWDWSCGRGSSVLSVVLYGFSHAGFWHLAFNMWTLLVFGDAVNRRIGNKYYLMAYLSSILLIGFFCWLIFPGRVIGASGAVFTVIGISLLLLPAARLRVGMLAIFPVTLVVAIFNRPKEFYQWAIRWGDFFVPMLWCLLLVPLLEFFGLLWSGWSWTNLGHLMGLVLGVVFVLLLP